MRDDGQLGGAAITSIAACRARATAIWPGLDRERLSRARTGSAVARLVAARTNEPLEVVVGMLGPACAIEPPQARAGSTGARPRVAMVLAERG
jgi:hypothetical protein